MADQCVCPQTESQDFFFNYTTINQEKVNEKLGNKTATVNTALLLLD